jgi:parallel beta-helix repeat protein
MNTVLDSLDFVSSIKSNAALNLGPYEYSLANLVSVNYDRDVFFRDTFDGSELVIRDLENIKFSGVSSVETKILTSPSHSTVLNFENSNSVDLTSLSIGHGPDKGSCSGKVLSFLNCNKGNLINLELFGCGIDGLTLIKCSNFNIENCTIHDCTDGILHLYDCEHIRFINCKFYNNLSRVTGIGHSNKISFINCIFENNQRSEWSQDNYIFQIYDTCGSIELINCTFDDSDIIEVPEKVSIKKA